MPRSSRLDAPGTLHHVIFRGIERKQIVDDDKDRQVFIDRLGQLSKDLKTPIYAWSLMTNHGHILIRSGPDGLSSFMRKLLTGYAINYNRRHYRHGHLFQNRYKSIVCEEDAYFKELVRYIHLNPLRANLVDSMQKLDWYRWCGHSAIIGRRKNPWQARDYVLKWFGGRRKETVSNYRNFVKQGVELGKQSNLTGGGLIRSAGGWSEVKALRRIGDRQASDARILGGGDFVKQVTGQMDLARKYRLTDVDRVEKAKKLIVEICEARSISIDALKSGSRIDKVSILRADLALQLVKECGLTLSESARQLGVCTSAIAKIIKRKEGKSN
jgi:REP element-mobilizing transposase RayT